MPTQWSWFTFWLFIHILTMIVAFGPTFAFPLIVARSQKEPQYAHFGSHIIHLIETKMTIPLALTLIVSGTGLIVTTHVVLFRSEWLLIALALYAAAVLVAIFVQTPNSSRMLEALSMMPPGPPPEGAGPSPEIAGLGKKLQVGGMYLTLSVVVIVVLMIWRPGACSFSC